MLQEICNVSSWWGPSKPEALEQNKVKIDLEGKYGYDSRIVVDCLPATRRHAEIHARASSGKHLNTEETEDPMSWKVRSNRGKDSAGRH